MVIAGREAAPSCSRYADEVKRSGAALFLGLERLSEAPRERVEKAGLLTDPIGQRFPAKYR